MMACLYLDINHTGILGRTGAVHDTPGDQVRINYSDLPEDNDAPSEFSAAVEILADAPWFSSCKRAVVTLPPDWVWIRHTRLPFNDPKKLGQILPMELAPTILVPDLTPVIDFRAAPLPDSENNHLIFTGILAAKTIEDIFSTLKRKGISLSVVSPRGLIEATTFASSKDAPEQFLFISPQADQIVLVLVNDRFPIMVRTLGSIASDPVSGLAREIRSTYTSAALHYDLDHKTLNTCPIFVGHTQGKIPDGLEDALTAICPPDTPPKTVAPPDAILPDRLPPNLLNFCTGPYKTDVFHRRHKGHLITTVVLLTLIVALSLFDLHRKNTALENQISAQRDAEMSIYTRVFPKAGPVPAQAPLLLMESKLKELKRSGNTGHAAAIPAVPKIRVMDMLFELSTRIPEDIDMAFSRLTLNHDRLILTGLTANFNQVDKIKGLIQSSPLFKRVSIQSAKADKTGKKVRFKFILEI